MPKDVFEALLSFVERTENRSNATDALNVLVESGVMGEFAAMGRLDEWKEHHLWT